MAEAAMVGRVAKALEECFEGEGRVFDRDQAKWLAEAAIRAMREPTPAMVEKGVWIAMTASLGGNYRWPDYVADKG